MYTVIRFCPANDSVSETVLRRTGEKLNRLRPGSYTGMGRLHKLFSVSVEDSELWWDHLAAMEAFLKKCGPFIDRLHKDKIETEFDVAVWQWDYEKYNALGLPLSIELVEAMAVFGVTITFRIYFAGRQPKVKSERSRKSKLSNKNRRDYEKARKALRQKDGKFAHWLHKNASTYMIPRELEIHSNPSKSTEKSGRKRRAK